VVNTPNLFWASANNLLGVPPRDNLD